MKVPYLRDIYGTFCCLKMRLLLTDKYVMLTGNLKAVEHGSDHGVSYVASTLHWGPDAAHNAYYLTHKGK